MNKKSVKFLTYLFLFFFSLTSSVLLSHTKAYAASRTYTKNGASDSFSFSCSSNWYAGSSDDWIFITSGENGAASSNKTFLICYDIKPNNTGKTRTGHIVINKRTGSFLRIDIVQLGNPNDSIQVISSPSGTYSQNETTLTLSFIAYEDWYLDSNSSFLTMSKTTGQASSEIQTVTLHLPSNKGSFCRTIVLTLHTKDKSCSRVICFDQNCPPHITNASLTSHLISAGCSTNLIFTASSSWEFFYLPPFLTASIYYGNAGQYNIKLTANSNAKGQTDQVIIYCGNRYFTYDVYVSAY